MRADMQDNPGRMSFTDLGTASTIDMTQAFASVGANGRSITPYGISKVTTIDGEILYAAIISVTLHSS